MLSLYGSHSSSDQGYYQCYHYMVYIVLVIKDGVVLSPTPSSSCSLEASLKPEHVASVWLFAISEISGSYVHEQTVGTMTSSSEVGELPWKQGYYRPCRSCWWDN